MLGLASIKSHQVAENLPDIGIVYLTERFFSDNNSGDSHIQVGTTGIMAYRQIGGDNRTYGGENTPEIKTLLWVKNEDLGIGKISVLNSLGYCIGSQGIAWVDLHTGEVHTKILFEEIKMGMISKIDTIQAIGYGEGGVFKFRKERKMTEKIMGAEIANMIHSDIEAKSVEWKHTKKQLDIGSIEKVFPNYEGNIVIGKMGFCIIDSKGAIILTNTYEQLGFTEIVQIYTNGWIVGENSVLQIDFHTGEYTSPIQTMNIKEFIAFSQKNKHSLMEEPRWDGIVPDKKSTDIIGDTVSETVKKITQ